jgi:hypothetical protein
MKNINHLVFMTKDLEGYTIQEQLSRLTATTYGLGDQQTALYNWLRNAVVIAFSDSSTPTGLLILREPPLFPYPPEDF